MSCVLAADVPVYPVASLEGTRTLGQGNLLIAMSTRKSKQRPLSLTVLWPGSAAAQSLDGEKRPWGSGPGLEVS
jgi:hypothetical protein